MADQRIEQVRNHWYWRPGWSVGRRFYTWHLTFADQPDVVAFVATYRDLLQATELTDVVPPEWLHLTMQGIGFVDEVDEADVDAIEQAARRRCAALEPFVLTVGHPRVRAEAVLINVQPPEPVVDLRLALRAAIADVWGPARVPEAAEPFFPHLSLAYINRDASAGPLADAVDVVGTPPIQITIRACRLIVINRDDLMYRWDVRASVPLGDPG